MAQIDLRNVTIRLFDGSGVPNYIDVKIGEGDLSWSEKRQLDAVKSRGNLDTFRENEQVPLELSVVAIWEFIASASGEPITVEDALKRRNGASAWVSASPDALAPYCVNLAVIHTPPCSGVLKETVTFPQCHYIEIASSVKDGTLAIKLTCNCTEPTVTRG